MLHEQEIIDTILAHIDKNDCSVKNVSLICGEEELKVRLLKDVEADKRQTEISEEEKMRILQEKSLELLEEYKDSIDPEIFEEAKNEIKKRTKSISRKKSTKE